MNRAGFCSCPRAVHLSHRNVGSESRDPREPPRNTMSCAFIYAQPFQLGAKNQEPGDEGVPFLSSPALTWMAWTSRLLSSRAAEAVDDPKEAAPRCSPRMRRPSFLYCSMGSHRRSRNPWTVCRTGLSERDAKTALASLPCTRTLTSFPNQFLFPF